MKEHLDLNNLPLANTEAGKNFVMKALHPSDHEIRVTRVPGGSDNTVAMAIDQVFDYVPSVKSGTTAKPFMFIVRPNIQCPIWVFEENGTEDGWTPAYSFVPPAFAGKGYLPTTRTDDADTWAYLTKNVEAVRITSESLTTELVAPSLSNQGTVVANQYAVYKQNVWSTIRNHSDSAAIHPDGSGTMGNYTVVLPYQLIEQFPTKSMMMNGTRAFSGNARDGAYLPLRLDNFKMRGLGSIVTAGVSQLFASDGYPMITPFAYEYSPDILHNLDHNFFYGSGGTMMGGRYFGDLSNTYGQILYSGISTDGTSIRCRFRMTVELRTYPGTNLAPLAEVPPPADSLAIDMYHEIAGRMKNAYPASYNDWDQLKKTIKTLARGALAVVNPAIHYLAQGLPMGGAIGSIASSLAEGLQRKLDESANQMTDVEKAKMSAIEGQAAQVAKSLKKFGEQQKRKAQAAQPTKARRRKLRIVRPQQVVQKQ